MGRGGRRKGIDTKTPKPATVAAAQSGPAVALVRWCAPSRGNAETPPGPDAWGDAAKPYRAPRAPTGHPQCPFRGSSARGRSCRDAPNRAQAVAAGGTCARCCLTKRSEGSLVTCERAGGRGRVTQTARRPSQAAARRPASAVVASEGHHAGAMPNQATGPGHPRRRDLPRPLGVSACFRERKHGTRRADFRAVGLPTHRASATRRGGSGEPPRGMPDGPGRFRWSNGVESAEAVDIMLPHVGP